MFVLLQVIYLEIQFLVQFYEHQENVVTMDAVNRLIKLDMTDPITGQKLNDSDIIPLQRGGTGYSGSGVQLDAKLPTPAMQ